MPRFPKKEAEINALAERLWRGLWSNRPIYSNPPVHPISIRFKAIIYRRQRENLIAKQAAAEDATTTKDEALDDLVDAMKSDIRYAENTVNFDDDKLKLIGWAGKKTKTPLAPPGQARLLERPEGPWQEVATAVITEATLVEQPRGKELEYRIIAVNKAGEGEPSNTVMVVL